MSSIQQAQVRVLVFHKEQFVGINLMKFISEKLKIDNCNLKGTKTSSHILHLCGFTLSDASHVIRPNAFDNLLNSPGRHKSQYSEVTRKKCLE